MEADACDPDDAIEAIGGGAMSDEDTIDMIVTEVLNANPKEVARYKNGETKLLPFFLGQIMKAAKGNADPATATEALKNALGSC